MAANLQDEMPSREHNPKNVWACLLERGELLLVAVGACVFFLQLHYVVVYIYMFSGVKSHAKEGRPENLYLQIHHHCLIL